MKLSVITITNSFSDYETISNKLTFDEENPEWASMDISLKVDPTGKADPVIIAKRTPDSESLKKSSGNTPLLLFFHLTYWDQYTTIKSVCPMLILSPSRSPVILQHISMKFHLCIMILGCFDMYPL